jgi:hypothetical protein
LSKFNKIRYVNGAEVIQSDAVKLYMRVSGGDWKVFDIWDHIDNTMCKCSEDNEWTSIVVESTGPISAKAVASIALSIGAF